MPTAIPGFPSEGWVVDGAKKSRSSEDDSDAVSDILSLTSIRARGHKMSHYNEAKQIIV